MSPHLLRTAPAERARLPALVAKLKRFAPEIRPAAAQLARRHIRLAELAASFPALLVALAWPRTGFDPRPVIRGVIAGVPLASLARAAGLPLWLRRMPPEMLVAPVPVLPDSPFLRGRIVNHFPTRARYAAHWFRVVSFAHRWADEDLALWAAKAFADGGAASYGRPGRRNRLRLPVLALYGWHSAHPEAPASVHLRQRWTPEMSLETAWREADDWMTTVRLHLELAGHAIDDGGLGLRAMDGHDFVPLRDAAAVAEEAFAMNHCLRRYGGCLSHDSERFWSIRKDGERVATLSLAWHDRGPFPVVSQLKLKDNRLPSAALWLTARRWLEAQDVSALARPYREWGDAALDRAAWTATWKPYWRDRRRVPRFLPLSPSRDVLDGM